MRTCPGPAYGNDLVAKAGARRLIMRWFCFTSQREARGPGTEASVTPLLDPRASGDEEPQGEEVGAKFWCEAPHLFLDFMRYLLFNI